MATLRITSAELERDVRSVLDKAREGVEFIVEQGELPDVVIKSTSGPGRPLSECLERALAYEADLGEAPKPDPGFAADVLAGIEERAAPLDPPQWD